jgi:uroporphyrin-III C-methyltransferase/precorrin-2 dehydrogenase/sirohydrochlorin ferrochelatase/uroporphyrin-III C-methyltransferase
MTGWYHISRISVGKEVGKHCVPQDKINETIVSLARSGRHVVRLKGGDPYMFGRGGEEALTLIKHQIAFEIVPGITAASGCSAYSGIPLTHRGMSRRVQFITGHFNDDEPLNLNWKSIADPDSTLVIYMGMANIDLITGKLIEAGLDADIPAAAIENGTKDQQRRVLTTLGKLALEAHAEKLQAPVIFVIGKTGLSLKKRPGSVLLKKKKPLMVRARGQYRTSLNNILLCAGLMLLAHSVYAKQDSSERLSEQRRAELHNLLLQDCGSCHGMTLKGGLGPALTPGALKDKPREFIELTIREGRSGTPCHRGRIS